MMSEELKACHCGLDPQSIAGAPTWMPDQVRHDKQAT
jgi:hypothetical protein